MEVEEGEAQSNKKKEEDETRRGKEGRGALLRDIWLSIRASSPLLFLLLLLQARRAQKRGGKEGEKPLSLLPFLFFSRVSPVFLRAGMKGGGRNGGEKRRRIGEGGRSCCVVVVVEAIEDGKVWESAEFDDFRVDIL